MKRSRSGIPSTYTAVKDAETYNSRRSIPGAARVISFIFTVVHDFPLSRFFLSPPKNNTPTNINQIFLCPPRVSFLSVYCCNDVVDGITKKKKNRTVSPSSSFDKRPEREMLWKGEEKKPGAGDRVDAETNTRAGAAEMIINISDFDERRRRQRRISDKRRGKPLCPVRHTLAVRSPQSVHVIYSDAEFPFFPPFIFLRSPLLCIDTRRTARNHRAKN